MSIKYDISFLIIINKNFIYISIAYHICTILSMIFWLLCRQQTNRVHNLETITQNLFKLLPEKLQRFFILFCTFFCRIFLENQQKLLAFIPFRNKIPPVIIVDFSQFQQAVFVYFHYTLFAFFEIISASFSLLSTQSEADFSLFFSR